MTAVSDWVSTSHPRTLWSHDPDHTRPSSPQPAPVTGAVWAIRVAKHPLTLTSPSPSEIFAAFAPLETFFDSPPDPAELSEWLRARLSHYKCPREYHLVSDLLRTTMGKINKRRLRDAWLAGDLEELVTT